MKLSEFVEINPRTSLPKGTEAEFVPMEALNPSRRYVKTYPKKKYSGGTKFVNGDTLFARITPCLENGKISQFISTTENPAFGSTEYWIFRAKDGISDPSYVYYLAKSDLIRKPAEKSMVGASGRQRAQIQSVQDLDIGNVSLTDQQKIAGVLGAYDDLIENNSKRIEKLEAMARLLYEDLLNKSDKKDYKISDFVELQNGFAFKSNTFTDNGRFGVTTIKNVQDGKFSTDSLSRIDFIPERMPEHCILKKGDILMSLTGNVGRVSIVTKNSMLLNQRVAKLVSDYYALTYCLFRSRSMLTRLENLSNGTAQQNLSPVMTRDLIVSLPGELQIKKFEELCSPILTQIVRLNEKNDILAQARDLLLPRLMSGEMKV